MATPDSNTIGCRFEDRQNTANMIVPGALTAQGDLAHTGTKVGFYGTAAISKQTGVAVSAAGIHAACVALGLFAA